MNRLCTGWWRDCGWISNRHKSSPHLQGDQTSSGTCPASCSVSTVGFLPPGMQDLGHQTRSGICLVSLFGQYCGGLFCLAWRSWDMRLNTLFYLVPRLRMHGAVPPLLICLLGIHRDNFTLTYRITWCTLSAFQGNTSVQKMVATASSEMFVPLYQKTWCHIPEVCNFNILSLFTFCNI